MQVFLKSLLSRKFLLTLSGVIALYSIHQYDQMCILILGYLGVEGGADIVGRYKERSLTATDVQNAVSQNVVYELDTSQVLPGNAKPAPLFNESEKE
jgi:hypothetical protein